MNNSSRTILFSAPIVYRMKEVLSLPPSLPEGVAVTVDFEAARELGHELILLRVPELARPVSDPRLAALSQRALEIVAMIAGGHSNKKIAAKLFISLATVKAHVHHILTKTGLPNRTAIAAAHLAGLHHAARTQDKSASPWENLRRSQPSRNHPLD
jgi:DNA-binding NarL/FixJ family response regulator